MSNEQEIEFTELGAIGLVTLNRPQALNALNFNMIVALHKQLQKWEQQENIKLIMVKGNGNKAFCAGGDIRQVYVAGIDNCQQSQEFFWQEYRLNYYIQHYSKPYLALLDGITMGGGVGISIHGSYRIATENLVFAMPETSIGFFPDVGGSYFLPRCPQQTGIYLGLTSVRINATEAWHLGLVDYCINKEVLPHLCDELLSKHADNISSYTLKNLLQAAHTPPTTPLWPDYLHELNECFAQPTVEAIMARLEQSDSQWAQTTVELLRRKSPTSLKVTLQQLRQGAHLNFAECMRMEYRLTLRFLQSHDFYEGIRAMIIDKDQKPRWQPAHLAEISPEQVNAYFAPLADTAELELN